MSELDNNSASKKLEAKRAAVLASQSNGKRSYLPLVLIAVAAIGALGFLSFKFMPEEAKKPATGQMFGYVPKTGEISYPLSDINKGTINFYQHKADGGVIVRYLVGLDSQGNVTTALDACADCWRSSKGHRQEGDALVCQNCDKKFSLAELADSTDPCAPLPLAHTIRDGRVIIAIPDLLGGAKYFKKVYGSI